MQRLILGASKRQLMFILVALAISAVALGVIGSPKPADASSHREAPYISGDPQADATDVYAFRSPDKPNTVTLVANYVPLEVAAAGPNFYKFGDDVVYDIHIDNNGDAIEDITYRFDFFSTVQRKNPVGLVEAFKRAFTPGEGPALMIKTINADFRPEARERVRHAIGDRPDIRMVDVTLTAEEMAALLRRADCFASPRSP